MKNLKHPATYVKTILAVLTAGVGSLITAAADNSIVTQEWLIALGAALAAAGLVYNLPNAKVVDEGPPVELEEDVK